MTVRDKRRKIPHHRRISKRQFDPDPSVWTGDRLHDGGQARGRLSWAKKRALEGTVQQNLYALAAAATGVPPVTSAWIGATHPPRNRACP
jgi:hypothetical protein